MAYKKALVLGLLLSSLTAVATIFGTVSGLIHDPQHRPVQGAQVTLRAANSAWTKSITSGDSGEFRFDAVPLGEYSVTLEIQGFASEEQKLVLSSGRDARLHFSLTVAQAKETVEVTDTSAALNSESSANPTLVSRRQISETPGADQTNSLSMITNYVPGAYMVHDQLHVRGGHQVSWLIDGVPVPNTNIASNVGPQFDPKDIDYLEVQRGGYSAEYGDRTYGVFNVVTRSGFERDRQAELVTSYGNFNRTEDQISFGSHTQRFAYYASLNGNRSNLGLETPVAQIIHDQENGFGGFGSLLFNADPSNQLRLVTSLRRDYYQIPNTPDQQSSAIRNVQREADAFLNFSWVHTFSPRLLLTVSPFFHFNSANFDGGPNDPISATDDHSSRYAGRQATRSATFARNEIQLGFYGFGQHDHQVFGLLFNDVSNNQNFREPESVSGSLEALFLEDKFKITSWLTLMGGVRQTHFSGSPSENANSPRAGDAVTIPHLNWVFRGFYGHFYQAPPLITAFGPLLQFVTSQNLAFIPLHGERDEEHQFGVTIPIRGWTLDADNFKTHATNFFDHNSVGNSDIFFPLTVDG